MKGSLDFNLVIEFVDHQAELSRCLGMHLASDVGVVDRPQKSSVDSLQFSLDPLPLLLESLEQEKRCGPIAVVLGAVLYHVRHGRPPGHKIL